MIHRYYTEGEKLDVAGLNVVTVLIDRSETELTEIGHNCWRPRLDGPPHKHNDKDQIFYITSGVGKVKLGNEIYDVKKGNIAYVPAGLVHQTITTGDEPLCYMLFNIFNNTNKEGHLSFKDHIEKVKQIRKQQAESGKADVDGQIELDEIKAPKFIDNIYNAGKNEKGKVGTIILLEKNETNRCELNLVKLSIDAEEEKTKSESKERTIFILNGIGEITIDGESAEVKTGDVLFVPKNTFYSVSKVREELEYLCMNSII
jgi:mannose-6-phosphate isomerase-like protein (cupin superfamily)